MNLKSLDLNLLLVLDGLLRTRHVTRASGELGMSQPAVSNALNRLRHHLKDELFVRTKGEMRPTPRALELAAPVRAALETLSLALDPAQFDPETAVRSFSIGTNDYAVSTLMPKVMERLEAEAPGISLRLVPSAGRTLEMLDAQELDFGLSAFGETPERFERALLIDDSYVLMMRRGHSLANGPMTLETYAQARHMLMSPRGQDQGFVDRELAKHGLTRHIAITVNSFAAAPGLLAGSDLILAAPKRIADTFAPLYGLAVRAAPIAGPQEYASATLLWHGRFSAHPAYQWFIDFMKELSADF